MKNRRKFWLFLALTALIAFGCKNPSGQENNNNENNNNGDGGNGNESNEQPIGNDLISQLESYAWTPAGDTAVNTLGYLNFHYDKENPTGPWTIVSSKLGYGTWYMSQSSENATEGSYTVYFEDEGIEHKGAYEAKDSIEPWNKPGFIFSDWFGEGNTGNASLTLIAQQFIGPLPLSCLVSATGKVLLLALNFSFKLNFTPIKFNTINIK